MTVLALPVDQRVIDIDSRRFASIEKALVELITNCDDSYVRLERKGFMVAGKIGISYKRYKNGSVLTVSDQAEGMSFDRIRSVLSYGGAHSLMSQGVSGGRGFFGRGMKQAIFGLGHGWIESIFEGRYSRVDLFRGEDGRYLFDDGDTDRPAEEKDYHRLHLTPGDTGSMVTIVVDNPQTNIPYFSSLSATISNNIYLRDILFRRSVEITNRNLKGRKRISLTLAFEEPEAEVLVGPDFLGSFIYEEKAFPFYLTLKKSLDEELVLKGDERTNGLLIISGTAVFDCQFLNFENQLGTEFLFGTVRCPGLSEMMAEGVPIISDEREGLNLKDPFVLAFSDGVSELIRDPVNRERQRLSHIERATTSRRTQNLIGQVLQKMNQVAIEDLNIMISPGPGSGKPGPFDTGRPAVLRFSTPFYYRKVAKAFHVSLLVNQDALPEGEEITVEYNLPPSILVQPDPTVLSARDIPEDGRFQWKVIGDEVDARGRITVSCGPYSATGEIVIAENAQGKGYEHPAENPALPWHMDNASVLFRGYELRNLNNEVDRAVYSPEDRLIIINTEAPTVRLYVDGQGRFKDGARLLLAELLLDVITDELARLYVDRTTKKGQREAYRQAKQDMVRRYGVDVHSILSGV
ncbi:ATP-binding protein [Dehalobacterium formicoaceticum]|uniref:ATP-binding protein n=1 Tax=Dehalobacterium formicoaceticum TaxID=51515 RepID=A0ABT1Y267_9FIRM|nr:ATP-binding protein [Dehalobacterium formicoaceticum]MCR6544967.1 ATP-binding protein [Dehalobacterium formicoaceticum]